MISYLSEGIQKSDEMYYLMKTSFNIMFCVCTCIGLIVVLASMIDDEIQDGSN